ncbi:hypothetical protein FIBSPDRAFT_27450 [Athelia psychrophila]|uniref:Homeobox domain-containing protein n=1 Tax=Athelia psychrophila TaxID=1759441 RepID=A0A166G5N6_9AGAM|nr:hypothetical protein FIBSPDRAFT_27450 [Fibularhizoctonia sp. CBS 109695]
MDSTKRKRPTTPLSATLPVKRSVKKIKRNKPAEKPHYRYTKAQIAELEAYYKKNKYPSLDERSSKFGKWGIIGSKIESWFVRRRERARKNNELPARAVPIFPISEKGELELEILYQRMPFPSPTDQQELADRFGVKVKQIITW